MVKAFFGSKRWFWWAYGGGILLLALIYSQVSMSVRMNTWYGGFYDLLQHTEQHTFAEFRQKLVDFSWIAIPWTILAVITNYITRRYSLWWREAITFSYIPRWRRVKQEIEGSSQRIQEDPYRYAKIVESLGLQMARAVMTLVAFLPILWGLSKINVVVPFAGTFGGEMAWFIFLGLFTALLIDKLTRATFNFYWIMKIPGAIYRSKACVWVCENIPELTTLAIVFAYALTMFRIYSFKPVPLLFLSLGWQNIVVELISVLGVTIWVIIAAVIFIGTVKTHFPCVWRRMTSIIWTVALAITRAMRCLVAILLLVWRRIAMFCKPILEWLDENAPELTTVAVLVQYALWISGSYRGVLGWLMCAGCVFAYITQYFKAQRHLRPWARYWFVRSMVYFAAFLFAWSVSGMFNTGLPSFVWAAVFVSFGGTLISWLVGIKLPGLEYNNQKTEAAFRKELVLGEDDKINHSSIPSLAELFTGIKFNYRRLFWHYGYFDLWSNTFSQIMVVVPFLIAGPALFSGLITLGVLIQLDNAFGKVQNSFALFMENWTTVTELRSIRKRLYEFERNLDQRQPIADSS